MDGTRISEQVKQSIKPGDKKHYLTITSEPFYKGNNIYYEVYCDCGRQTTVNRQRFGVTKSCGCLVGEKNKPLTKIPSKLLHLKRKLINNGRLLVFENGTIFRVKGNFYFPARVFLTSGRETADGYDSGYPVITYSENNKQVHKTVHRLVGKAFLDKKEGAIEINHKDGNKKNNHVSNLEWVTPRENMEHAYETGLVRTLDNTPHECVKCKGPSMRSKELCSSCNAEMRQLKKTLKAKQRQRNLYRDIDTTVLKPVYKRVIKARFQGFTLRSIGEGLSCTREYVRQLEKRVLDKDPIVYKEKEINSTPIIEENSKRTLEFKITLKAARVNVGLSAVEVGQIISKNGATITNWEKGRTKIPLTEFKKLVQLYKVPLSLLSFKRDGNWIILEEE